MKRFWLKVIIFILLFIPVFLYVQNVLHYRWPDDDTYAKSVDFTRQPADSVDVVAFGTSEMYAAYTPVVTYEEKGITGYNLAVENRSAITTYYQFQFMLKHQKPKIVICDFACLFDDEYALPSVSETIYRRIVDGTPDPAIRLKLIREICRVDPGQDPVSWLFPVFRYHSMWNEITADNFKWDKHEAITFEPFKKGAEAMPVHFDGEPYEITPALWETDRSPDELKEFSMHYYDMMIAECKENGIAVVGLLTPKVSDAAVYQTNYPVMQSYFDSRGVTGLNYNTYEQIERMGLSMEEDYMDAAHLNARGSEKFSRALAADLKAIFHDLPDRREDARISPSWDADLKSYHDMVEGAEAEYDQEHR